MKTIYAFTLKGKDYLSNDFESDLRLFAYMLYTHIATYNDSLDMNDTIILNEIYEGSGDGRYYLASDINGELIDYEPFIVGSDTFAFTINNDIVNFDIIKENIEYIQKLLKFNYEVVIKTFCCDDMDINDEKNRYKAIKMVYHDLGYVMPRKYNLVSRWFNSYTRKRK